MLNNVILSVIMLNNVILSVIMLNNVILSVIMLNNVMLSVIMQSVVMPCVVAPQTTLALTQLRRLPRKLVFERFYDWVEIYAALNLLVGFFWCCDNQPNGIKYECLV
jgi:hypothetical protein